jgi:hypothetical protein
MIGEGMVLRAVVDANVFISALIRPEGPPGSVIEQVLAGAFRLVCSEAIADEVREVLGRPRVLKAIRRPEINSTAWFSFLLLLADMVEDRVGMPRICSDQDDDKYIWAAHEGRATFVVSGDAMLLALGEHDGVRIVTPALFLQQIIAH